MPRKQRRVDRPTWTESRNAATLSAAMLIVFLAYTLYMFAFFKFPGLPATKGSVRLYFFTIAVLTLTIITAALVVKFFQKNHRKGNQNK
jgi:hypothetical protein